MHPNPPAPMLAVKRHRLLPVALVAALFLSLVALFAPAPAFAAPGATAVVNDIEYTYDDEAAAGSRNATATDYTGAGGAVVIPDTVALPVLGGGTEIYTVNAIGDAAFAVASLTSVDIPNTITSMGLQAFRDNNLTSVVIPSSLATIPDGAFYRNDLTSVVIPTGVTTIGQAAFAENALTSLVLPSGVISIGDGAFLENDLTSVTLPNTLTTIGLAAFRMNALTTVTIPNSVTTVGPEAFRNNSLTSLVLSDALTTISDGAFYDNDLTSVVIPSGVSIIEDGAFAYNDLSSLVIPAGVTSIGGGAFFNSQLSTLEIPSAVTTIKGQAFAGNAGLTSVFFAGAVAPVIEAAGPNGSFGEAAGKTLYFTSGATGFATPTWQGYNTVERSAPAITTLTLPAATQGTAYSQQLAATGTPAPSFAVTSGTLPAGLSLSASGLISGTPTSVGASTFTVTATNALGTHAQSYTLTVAAAGAKTGSLANTGFEPSGAVGMAALLLLGAGAILFAAQGVRRARAQR